jgi:hypothetical protein
MSPIKRDVIYPIFLKCLSYAQDEFWKETFQEMSYGNCYQGSYISKGFLCSSVKGKEFNYKFIDKDHEKIYNDITKLLKEKLNIMSKNDRQLLLQEINNADKELVKLREMEWGEIKKKSFRDILFQNFVINAKNKYELKDYQVKCLYNVINLGIILKSIKNSDILYTNGEIVEIKGINFSKNKYDISLDIYSGLDEETIKSVDKKSSKLLSNL